MKKLMLGCLMAAAQAVSAANQIDLLVLYTRDVTVKYQDREGVLDRVAYLLDSNNAYYSASSVDIRLNAVAVLASEYDPERSVANATALKDLTYGRTDAFKNVRQLREYYGADLVVLLRTDQGGDVCGHAWNNRVVNTWLKEPKPIDADRNMGYSLVLADCGADSLGHELGHNLGLAHDRLNSGRGATYNWSTGHGVAGNFATLMTFGSVWGNAVELNTYSSPNRRCAGRPGVDPEQPCGVAGDDPQNGADSVRTLNTTGPVVSAWHSTNGLIPATNAVNLLR